MAANGIEARSLVWESLSELFLDTELGEADFERISSQLAESPFSIVEIENILRFEVFPKLKWNLMCIAGEWAGFERQWLVEELTPMIGRRQRFHLPSFAWRIIRDDRKRVFDLLRATRNRI